jgi:hypothetical protein
MAMQRVTHTHGCVGQQDILASKDVPIDSGQVGQQVAEG